MIKEINNEKKNNLYSFIFIIFILSSWEDLLKKEIQPCLDVNCDAIFVIDTPESDRILTVKGYGTLSRSKLF
jgi:hypothetical protein